MTGSPKSVDATDAGSRARADGLGIPELANHKLIDVVDINSPF